ncbi:MAG: endonuclease/exonuclease/phosphatase family protein [Mycobacteriaceae bacterium]|nr:endonuclease/exonuclease/phosphatase family protein [Mycobacteriaceae bacterium]
MLIAATMTPYLALTGPASVILLALARRWQLAAVAATVAAAAAATQIPMYRADKAPGSGTRMQAISANLRLGDAHAEALVSMVAGQVDILAVQELDSDELLRLSAAGLDDVLPYRLLHKRRPGPYGLGLWSRYPLSQIPSIGGTPPPFLGAAIQVPGVKTAPVVVVVHLANPWHIGWWARDIDALAQTLTELRRLSEGPVIVTGDMNSTLDMWPFRRLLRRGYRDAAEQAGAGFRPTFPQGLVIPPLLAIDHVLTLRCAAVASHTMTLPGSDHRAVRATLVVPADQ